MIKKVNDRIVKFDNVILIKSDNSEGKSLFDCKFTTCLENGRKYHKSSESSDGSILYMSCCNVKKKSIKCPGKCKVMLNRNYNTKTINPIIESGDKCVDHN